MKDAAKYEGILSQSNGSLMRASPLGIFGLRYDSDEKIAEIAKFFFFFHLFLDL